MYKTRVAEPYPVDLGFAYAAVVDESLELRKAAHLMDLPTPMAWKGDDYGRVVPSQWSLDAVGELCWSEAPDVLEPFVPFGGGAPKG